MQLSYESMCSKEGISKTWLYLTITLNNRAVLGDQVEHNINKYSVNLYGITIVNDECNMLIL